MWYDRMSQNRHSDFSRRDLTKALATVSVTGFAGCSFQSGGDGDGGEENDGASNDGSQDLGERVPTISLRYFTNIWATGFFENTAPIAKDNWEELGITTELEGSQVANYVGDLMGGKYNHQVSYLTGHTNPERLDPNFVIVDEYRIDGAGSRNEAGTSLNYGQYASCDYSVPAWDQETAADEETRRELVTEAQEVLSEDYMSIVIAPTGSYGAIDTDVLDPQDVGTFGINNRNIFFMLNTHPTDGGRKITTDDGQKLNARNPYLTSDPSARLLYEYSTLVAYGPDAELQPYLAEDWEISDGAKTFTFTLRDATFQDGAPITAGDVKFSFEFLENNHSDLPGAQSTGFSSVEAPDEKTVVVNFDEPSLSFLSRDILFVGILNPDVWEEADGAAGEFSPPNGRASGPFAMEEFEASRRMTLSTHTGHPEAPDPSDLSGLVVRAFNEETTIVQALGSGEVHQAPDISFNAFRQAGEKSNVETVAGLDYLPYALIPSFAQPPTKFSEFREALGMAVNRQEMQAVGLPGLDIDPELHSRPFIKRHPWAAPDDVLVKFTDQPTGDIEGARQVLADAGWGWDDQGNLHYPPDADTSPRWPEGEAPSPENYPCLDQILEG